MNKKNFIKLARLIAKFAEVTTDKGTLIYDGELAVGIEVTDENGEVPADGEYAAEDGRIIVVAEGKVAELRDPEPEETVDDAVEEVVEAEEEVPATETAPEAEAPVEPDEKDILIAELQAKVAEYETTITELENKIKELEDAAEAPVEEPVALSAVAQQKTIKSSGALKYFE